MKKSFMNNIKHFVDSNVRQRIDRAANNNNDFFGDDLLLVERQFEDIRHMCVEAEKRISALLQSLNSSSLGAYTHNVQASLTSLTTAQSPNSSSIGCAPPNSSSAIPNETQSATIWQPYPSSISSKSNTTTLYSNESLSLSTISNNNNSNQSQQASGSATATNDATELRNNDIRRHKKLPIVGFLKFLVKSCYKLKPDSLLATTLTHCSHLQQQLTKLYLSYEQIIESQCLKPIQHILEIDVPNVIKLRKLFIKAHNDLESVKAKYNGASMKQQHLQQLQAGHFTSTSYTITQTSAQQANINKLDQLKKELDEAVTRFEQARDTYATELYAFVCRETELVNLFIKLYQCQAEYHQHVGDAIQNSLPALSNILASTPRKVVFGTPLEEHLRCTGRSVSLVIELCVHLLYTNALNEEGLFRIPGSSVKIKKLKSAINAWFVTLASQSELENDPQQLSQFSNQSSVLAIYDLFKDIVGQRPQQTTIVGSDMTINNQLTTTRDDSNSTHTSPSSTQDLVFDMHAIAGLLKLYLRELPEPLFTYALYDQWIDATVKTMNNEQPVALERVIEQLPKANYDNLHHLIRFLHLLTCHREFNKMTATNLAITMAPSLIWARPNNQQSLEQPLIGDQQHDDMQTLNMQMSTVGISASLHALVIENLINNAEKLFPAPIQYTLIGLKDVPAATASCEVGLQKLKHERCIKSTSPTGLSTASSSSFSSASNGSVTSSVSKRHSRKGGSMDGLLDKNSSISLDQSRPISIHLQKEQSQAQQPPPVPPAPVTRSHLRQASDSSCPARYQKPLAPPLPSQSTLKHHQQCRITSTQGEQYDHKPAKTPVQAFSNINSPDFTTPVTGSLRGTGTIALPTTVNGPSNLNATRPTVPPPNRPPKAWPGGIDRVDGSQSQRTKSEESDNKSSNSLSSSVNLRADFEEINAVDVDDIDINIPISPAVSLDSISGEDSSFDNECRSLEHSSTESVSDQNQLEKPTSEPPIPDQNKTGSHHVKPSPRLLDKAQRKRGTSEELDERPEEVPTTPPVKPPRSISPKVTQSTPL